MPAVKARFPRPNPLNKLDTPELVRAYVNRVAAHRGWLVNPDSGLVDPILAGLATQARKMGLPYCPCRDVDGGEADKDIVCPCLYAQPDIDQSGQCFCGLYLSPGKDPGDVGSIPERRPEKS